MALIGTLKLVPIEEQQGTLKQDYEKMAEMFMGEYPDFDTVLTGLVELESQINDSENL